MRTNSFDVLKTKDRIQYPSNFTNRFLTPKPIKDLTEPLKRAALLALNYITRILGNFMIKEGDDEYGG
jgi:hypothetical protein